MHDDQPPFDGGPERPTNRFESTRRDSHDPDDRPASVTRRDALKLLGAGTLAGPALAGVPAVARGATRIQKLAASDGQPFARFGEAVAVSGDAALVGSSRADTADGEDAGAAYVFTRDRGAWSESAKLAPSDARAGLRFGTAVALAGDTALVGATATSIDEPGAAYVFTRAAGGWTGTDRLTASDAAGDDDFGISVALSGDASTALVGALGASVGGEQTGAAYVFEADGSGWSETAKLSASDAAAGDAFGNFEAVALDRNGTTAVVGDALKTDESGDPVGAAYVFRNDGADWTRDETLTAGGEADELDLFGTSVAVNDDGTTAVVGATFDDDALDEGAVYVFTRDDGSWSQNARLLAQDGHRGDALGFPVAVSGDGETVLAGATRDDDSGLDAGAAYLFRRDPPLWFQADRLTASDPDPTDEFGSGLALDGATGLVGAAGDDNPNGTGAGAVYVFEDLLEGPVPSVDLADVRPVQTVERTVLRDPSGDDEPVEPAIPDFVAGRNMSVVFDLDPSAGVDALPAADQDAVVTVTRDYADRIETDTLDLSGASDWPTVFGSEPGVAALDAVGGSDGPPVFDASDDLVEIRVSITPADPGAAAFSGDTATIEFAREHEVVAMDNLTVGFVEIGDPEGGANFGGTTGLIKDSKTDLVAFSEEFYGLTYPVERVISAVYPIPLDDPSVISTERETIVEDLKAARIALEEEYPVVDFDVTVAFVPEDYPSYHKTGFKGVHYTRLRGAAAVRGDLRLDFVGGEDFFKLVSAHEVGHHFLGEAYPDELAMRGKGGKPGNFHARTERSAPADEKYIDSTGFDLLDNRYELVGTDLESFMSYNDDDFPTWVDAHAYTHMIDTQLAGHDTGDAAGEAQEIIDGVGRLSSDDAVTFTQVFATVGHPVESVDGGAVTLTVRDALDDPIDVRTVPDHMAFAKFGDPEDAHGVDEDVFAFAVPFPESAAAIDAERDGVVTRLNPIERTLRESVARLPDGAFVRAAAGRRRALDEKLDAVGEQMAAKEYEAARAKLERDVRDKVVKWLRDDYDTEPLQPTKDELLALVDEMIDRLDRLAADAAGDG